MISKLAIAGLIGLFLSVATASPARADDARVLLVRADPALAEAVRTALVPWRLSIVVVDVEPPPSTVPAATRAAREIARAHQAGAVVWISVEDGVASLWVYDVADDQIIARPLQTPPPFAPETAAAAALSVKTLLRHSAVAPVRERLARPPPRKEPSRRFETTVGLRLRRTEANDVEPRLGFGPVWWLRDSIGVALRLESGPGISISEGAFIGRFTDTTAGAVARARLRSGPWQLAPELGASIQFTGLDGAVLSPEAAASVTRANPAVDAAVTAGRRLGDNAEIGIRIRATALLEAQRYLVQGTPILTLPRTEVDVALVFGAGVF